MMDFKKNFCRCYEKVCPVGELSLICGFEEDLYDHCELFEGTVALNTESTFPIDFGNSADNSLEKFATLLC